MPRDLYDSAMQHLACRQRSDMPVDRDTAGDLPACPAGAVVSPLQIDAELRTAAAHGSVDARRYLLMQQASAVLQRGIAGQVPGQSVPLSASDEREVAAVIGQLELLALRGDRDSIDALAQLVESPGLAAPDPVYAAAWRLAARQSADQPFPAEDRVRGTEEIFDGLSDAQRTQVLALAPDLFAECCRRH
ncbi:hypothetical protein NY751_13675 [Xanthomonas campestris]|nr:hypothetical protein [Xanthomonas campestris]